MKHRWLTREERERIRARVAQPGGLRASIEAAKIKPALSTEERARKEAVNAIADQFGFPHPYPNLDDYPNKEEGQ